MEWKTIEEAPLYEVSDEGQVRRGGRILKPNTNGTTGHRSVHLRNDNRSIQRYIHRLVLMVFVGECPVGHECRHLDGNPNNNRLDNLAWGTRSENYNDARRHGTNTKGSIHGMSKLRECEVEEIRRLRSLGIRACEIGPMFKITPQNVSKICCGKAWEHVS